MSAESRFVMNWKDGIARCGAVGSCCLGRWSQHDVAGGGKGGLCLHPFSDLPRLTEASRMKRTSGDGKGVKEQASKVVWRWTAPAVRES